MANVSIQNLYRRTGKSAVHIAYENLFHTTLTIQFAIEYASQRGITIRFQTINATGTVDHDVQRDAHSTEKFYERETHICFVLSSPECLAGFLLERTGFEPQPGHCVVFLGKTL